MRQYIVTEYDGGGGGIGCEGMFFIVFVVLILACVLKGQIEESDNTEETLTEETSIYTYYEAEAEENTFGDGTKSTFSSGCSGGKKVGYIGNGESGTLTFNEIEAEEEGNYEVALFYCSGEERTVCYSVNGGESVSLDVLDTGGYNQTGVVTFVIELEAGTNTIAFGNANSYAPDIDRIGIRLLSEIDDDAASETHFYIYYSTDCTWEEAKVMCEEMDGHLATITSEAEQEIVKYLLNAAGRNSYWLGGYRSDESFSWITGEDFSYSNWASDQPDNYTGTEEALMMYRQENSDATDSAWGTWNDLNADGTCNDDEFFGTENMGFICEWEE